MANISDLPHIDEHAAVVAAGSDDTWAALLDSLEGGFAGTFARGYARAVGCDDTTASGPRPLAAGSTLPGFRVVTAAPGRELVLQGRHRFSSYALIFRIDELAPDRCRLRAESRATFPGVLGAAYRALVIGTRGHVVGVRRLLAGVRRDAEQRNAAGRPL